MSDLEGVMLGEYLLLQHVSGGRGVDVYRARQQGEGSYEVAVKVFKLPATGQEAFVSYFMSEAEKIGRFDHPHILPLLEYGEGDGLLYLVMPYVGTGTLEDLLKRLGGRLSALQALPVVQQLCSALQYAHEQDVIHGNIKPANIFVASDGRLLLADFRVTRGYESGPQSLTGMGWGTAEYIAPEQSLGVLRKGSDIYSLGALLFRLLTGVPPFSGQNPVEIVLKHVRQAAPSVRELAPDVSATVDTVLGKALEKRSENRYATPEEFSQAYQAAVLTAPLGSGGAVSAETRLLPQQAAAVGNQPVLPTGTLRNPHTPLPAAVALIPVSPTQEQKLLAAKEKQEELVARKSQPPALHEQGQAAQQEFPHAAGVPVEWSPIAEQGSQQQGVPLTAGEYLDAKALADVPTSPHIDGGKSINWRDRKTLWTMLVVGLLLFGLLGALFSAFLFPSEMPGVSNPDVKGTTDVKKDPITPTAKVGKTATAGTTATAGATATVTRQVATATATSTKPDAKVTPTSPPAAPPVVTFSCQSGKLVLNGSGNFQPVAKQLTTSYTTQCSGASFTVNADGSKAALDGLAGGSSDLAYVDLVSTGRGGLIDHPIAALTFSIIVAKDSGVKSLTVAQLQGIYTGKYKNWSQVGGVNESIVVVSRPSGSAIRSIFERHVLKGTGQTVSGVSLWTDTADGIVSRVSSTQGAISYVPLYAATGDVQRVAINGVGAVAEAVQNGSYPFWSIEHLYSDQSKTRLAQSFIDFCKTTSGQNVLASYGMVPIDTVSQGVLSAHGADPTT